MATLVALVGECGYNAMALQDIQSEIHPLPVMKHLPYLNGILVPTPTPFTTNGDVDLAALRSNIERWSASGISGCALLGSTGERAHLDEAEYLRVIEIGRAAVSSELAFIVGAGQQSTRGTIQEVRKAAAAGAEGVLVITPHFYRAAITQEALITHYQAVADASPVPVILYSMPALTGIKIEPDTVACLSRHENIVGVKDSSADVGGLGRTVELVQGISANSSTNGSSGTSEHQTSSIQNDRDGSPDRSITRDDFVVLTGNGTVLYEALRAGAVGGILAVGCVVPRLCLEIFRAVKAGENERAALLQKKLTPLAQAVTTKYGIGGLKAALNLIGYAGGAVRAPLRSPNEEALREIAGLLVEAQSAMADNSMEAAKA